MTKYNFNIQKITLTAILTALSIVLIMLIRIPFPVAPFLVYDIADVPVLLGTIFLGPINGLIILFIEAVFQAFYLDGDMGYGLIMHVLSSSVLILVTYFIFRIKKNAVFLIFGLVTACLATTCVMIIANLIVTPFYMGVNIEQVKGMILPIIIPFNSSKTAINSILTFLLCFPLNIAFKKIFKESKINKI